MLKVMTRFSVHYVTVEDQHCCMCSAKPGESAGLVAASLTPRFAGNHTCSEGDFAADPMTGRVVFNPYAVANMSAPPPPGHGWLYPFNVWPQRFSQKAGPWLALYSACLLLCC